MQDTGEFTIYMDFKDKAFKALIKKACNNYFPEVVFAETGDLFLSDDYSKIKAGIPAICFSEPEEKSLDGVTFIAQPFRLGLFLDVIQRHINKKAYSKWGDREIKIGDFTLRMRDGLLSRKDDPEAIFLTEKEREILLFLNKHNDEVVQKKTLLDNIWGYADGVETHTLETHIYRLRKKIETNPAEPEILITLDNGYKLA
jgi:two-component SAPR family response regulator